MRCSGARQHGLYVHERPASRSRARASITVRAKVSPTRAYASAAASFTVVGMKVSFGDEAFWGSSAGTVGPPRVLTGSFRLRTQTGPGSRPGVGISTGPQDAQEALDPASLRRVCSSRNSLMAMLALKASRAWRVGAGGPLCASVPGTEAVAHLCQGLDRGDEGAEGLDGGLAAAGAVGDGLCVETEGCLHALVEVHEVRAVVVGDGVVVKDGLADGLHGEPLEEPMAPGGSLRRSRSMRSRCSCRTAGSMSRGYFSVESAWRGWW